ncbi:hypothetical protein [Pseudonocardia thermophila]|uniref:hypothetical protein n=1 Tax=Pseudonocardia thermophila TaxID=1848 RepID=UPI00248E2848|nr:hypothetical protein [Pseudonocardia thermophila]
MPGPTDLIGLLLAAVLGAAPLAVAPAAPVACSTSTGSSTSWEQDARDLARLLADVDDAEVAALRAELERAGFGPAGDEPEGAPAAADAWRSLLAELLDALRGATDPQARALARSLDALQIRPPVAAVAPMAEDEEDEDEASARPSASARSSASARAGTGGRASVACTTTDEDGTVTRERAATPGTRSAVPTTRPPSSTRAPARTAEPTPSSTRMPTPRTTVPVDEPINPAPHTELPGTRPGCASNQQAAAVVPPAVWRPIAQALATALTGNTDPQAVALAADLAEHGFAPQQAEAETRPAAVPRTPTGTADLCGLVVAVVPLTSGTAR